MFIDLSNTRLFYKVSSIYLEKTLHMPFQKWFQKNNNDSSVIYNRRKENDGNEGDKIITEQAGNTIDLSNNMANIKNFLYLTMIIL